MINDCCTGCICIVGVLDWIVMVQNVRVGPESLESLESLPYTVMNE